MISLKITKGFDSLINNSMTLYQYKMFSEDEQFDTVFAKGKFLDIHIDGNIEYVLYKED